MVDVSGKYPTVRTATAASTLTLPEEVFSLFEGDEYHSPKGPVVSTAVIAGTMAVKNTPNIIPLCHQVNVKGVRISVSMTRSMRGRNEGGTMFIKCATTGTDVTGLEMEALTGASVAALTVYDMCKAASHDMVIRQTKLLRKTGGKSDIGRPAPRPRQRFPTTGRKKAFPRKAARAPVDKGEY